MKPSTTHAYPPPGSPYLPCCGADYRTLLGDRLTSDPAKVTCGRECK